MSPKRGPVKVNGEGLRPTKDIQRLKLNWSLLQGHFCTKTKTNDSKHPTTIVLTDIRLCKWARGVNSANEAIQLNDTSRSRNLLKVSIPAGKSQETILSKICKSYVAHNTSSFAIFLISVLMTKKLGCSAAAWKFVSNGVISILSTSSKHRGEVWRHVTIVALFLDDNKTKDEGRRLEEWQKTYVYINKQQLCTCITLFRTFLYRRCTTTTWNFLISRARFME